MKKKVKMVQVKLRLRDISNPTLFINCFDYMTMASGQEVEPDGMLGFIYKQGLEHAQQIADLVSVIIDDVDRSQKQATNSNSSSSVADELAKLADLNPNRSLGPIGSGDVKVFSCSPESKECLPLIHGSHKM